LLINPEESVPTNQMYWMILMFRFLRMICQSAETSGKKRINSSLSKEEECRESSAWHTIFLVNQDRLMVISFIACNSSISPHGMRRNQLKGFRRKNPKHVTPGPGYIR
jgi:hypothetical protein